MKRLVVLLLILTPWVMHPMEPEEVTAKVPEELKLETLAKRYLEGKEEELPGPLPHHIEMIIAQKLLSQGPKRFILSQVFLPFKDFDNNTGFVSSVKWDSTGDKIVTASSQYGNAKIWNVKTGGLIGTLLGQLGGYTSAAAFNRAGDRVVVTFGNAAMIWNTGTGYLLKILNHEDEVNSVAFNPAGDKVVTSALYSTAKIWDLKTGAFFNIQGHDTAVEFNLMGDKVLTGSWAGTAKIWDTTGKLLYTLEHTSPVMSAVFNQGGDKVVTGSQDGTAKIWDVKTGAIIHTLQGHTGGVLSAAFNPAGDKVVTSSHDTTARIWDAAAGTPLHTLLGHEDKVFLAAFNSAGDKVVTSAFDGTAKIWDSTTGALFHTLKAQPEIVLYVAAFNPAGDKVVAYGKDKVRIWDLGPLLSIQTFLEREITLRQAVTLNAIFETMQVQGIVKALENKTVWRAVAQFFIPFKEITFDFNKYPRLWEAYASLPEAIKQIFDPYVTKLSSSAEEQVPLES